MMGIKSRLVPTVVTAVVSVLAFTACGGTSTQTQQTQAGPATAPLLRIGSLQEPTSYDPAQANEGHLAPVYQAAYDPLIKLNPDGTLSPMLATSWEASADKLSYTLKLRTGVKFSDGEVFDSAAVKANMEHFKKANGPLASSLKSVASVTTPDPTTAVLKLSAADPGIPYSLTNAAGYMGAPNALEAPGIKTNPVGTGPYILDTANTVAGSKISYKRNDSYWGDKLPYDKVEFQILTDETARLNALKSGQIDAAILARAASATDAESAGLLHQPYSTNWEGIFFFDRNGTMTPELKDPRVREALTLAIDRDALLQAVALGKGQLTSQTFRPNVAAYDASLDGAYKYDPARAKQLLKDAGAENMTVTLPISPVFDPAIYDSIEQNWKAIGVKVVRHQWGPGQAIPSMLRGDFAVSYMSLVQRDDWRNIQLLIAPNAPYNPLKSQTPELNALIQKVQTGDEKTAGDAAKQLNQYLIDQHWFSPLYRLEQFFYHNDKVAVENQAEQAVPSIYNYKPTGK